MRQIDRGRSAPPAAPSGRVVRRALVATARSARLAWFSVTMATGIVSIALLRAGGTSLSAALLVVTIAALGVTAIANLVRAAMLPGDLAAELRDGSRSFTAFATVAALDVTGVRLAADGHDVAAAALAAAALAIWLLLARLIPPRLARHRPSGTDVNGSWYLCAVATQSLAIAAAFLRSGGVLPPTLAFWLGTTAFLLGDLAYLAVSVAVLARLRAVGLRRHEPTAPYWVAMGAASISALAAAQLRLAGAGPTTIGAAAFTAMAIAFWVAASCLLPVLAVRSAWRHLRWSVPMRYRAHLWMMVFPAGMYAVASIQVGTAAGWPILRLIGRIAVWPATAAWTLVFIAMAVSAGSLWRRRGATYPQPARPTAPSQLHGYRRWR